MSLLGISSAASQSAAIQRVDFLGHSRKKTSLGDSASNAGAIGQIPAGAGQNLLSNALQALEQAIGSQSASAIPGNSVSPTSVGAVTAAGAPGVNAPATATTTPDPANVKQDLHAFLHSLFQALKQEGSDGAGASTNTVSAAASAGSGTTAGPGSAANGIGQYAGSLESSLQTLIQQLGSTGTATPATAKLTTSFNNLVRDLTAASTASPVGSPAGPAATGAGASTAELKNFLSNFVQNLQHNGVQTPGLVGGNVNANA
jgi:hypothetical protein